MKKVISLILTLVILLGIALPASAAGNDGVTVSLVPSKAEIAPGEQFTAEMKIDKALTNLYCLQINLWWDADELTYNSGTAGTVCSNSKIEIGDPSAQTGNVFLRLFIITNDDGDPFDVAAGVLGTFTFTAKEGVSGSPSLKIEYEVIGNYDDFSEVTTTIDNTAANALTIKEAPAVTGYTITASEDKDIAVGEDATVSFQVGGDQATFNAYDLTITYDAGKLTYKSGTAADEGATIDGETAGTVRVVGYGADKDINTNVVTLTFTGKNIGSANVVVSSAKVDISAKAIDSNAPDAAILDDTTVITISGYTVKLGDGLSGDSVVTGKDYTFTATDWDNYDYEISATMGGQTAEVTDNDDGTYTIKKVTGDLLITVTKTSDLTVEVTKYITLDEQAMYLVTVSGTIAEGSIAKYDGMAMYWSEEYNAYAWLLVSADDLDAVKTAATGKVTIAEGTAAGTVDYSGDVNGTGTVDVNDVQLTYDMYNTKYTSIGEVSMLKFLNADTNFDDLGNVNDAAKIVGIIMGGQSE